MRHLGQVDYHGLARNVLAQRQRQRRFALSEVGATDDFLEVHRQALFASVGNFQAHIGLAGNHGHHAHRVH